MTRLQPVLSTSTAPSRRGATLTEVLMSLLIMSVGVISVFSLYPIAVLRSIQATQLTQSKILRINAEEELLADPAMLNGAPPWRPNTTYRIGDLITAAPLGNGGLATRGERFLCVLGGTSGPNEPDWNSAVGGRTADGTAGWLLAVDDDPGDGDTWPDTVGEQPFYGAFEESRSLTLSPALTTYVVDPLGWASHHRGGNTALRDSYGFAPRYDAGLRMLLDDGAAGSRDMGPFSGVRGPTVEGTFRGLFGTSLAAGTGNAVASDFDAAVDSQELSAAQLVRLARGMMRLPDTYENSTEEPIVGGITIATATPPTTLVADRLSVLTLPASPEMTALLTDLETTVASLEAVSETQQVRVIVEANNGATTSRWLVSGFDFDNNGMDDAADTDGTSDVDGINPDPVSPTITVGAIDETDFGLAVGTAFTIASVRFEINEARFSWLATIGLDNNGAVENAACVVFFRRAFDAAVEQGYECSIGRTPGSTTPMLVPGVPAPGNAFIRAVEGPTPAEITVGRNLFDSVNGVWYRIDAIVATGQGTNTDLTQIEISPVFGSEIEVANNTLNNPGDTRAVTDPQVVIPRGVVKVFPLNLNRQWTGRRTQ